MDWQQIVVIVAVTVLFVVPGYWLYRDAQKRGKNGLTWVVLYAFAAAPPRLRFILVPLVFAAWFILRDQEFRFFRKVGRIVSLLLGGSKRR
jgi:hypothetical protein